MGKKKHRDLSKGERSPALFAQPDPKSDKPDVWPLVIKDMADRDKLGRTKYGIPLRSHNGRDPLVDAYQEVLDLSVYMRQEIEERRDLQRSIQSARRIAGYENANYEDLSDVIDFLVDQIDAQNQHIRILSATVMHYQTQTAFISGYDKGVETAIDIFERTQGEKISPDTVAQILDAATNKRSTHETN